MADAVKFGDILVIKDFAGERHYAIYDAYKVHLGDLVETMRGLATVEKQYLDIDGEMYKLLTELNTVYAVMKVWTLQEGDSNA